MKQILSPRDPQQAAATLAVLLLAVAASITPDIILQAVIPDWPQVWGGRRWWAVALLVPLLVAMVGASFWRRRRSERIRGVGLTATLGSVMMITAVNISTRDASLGGQIFMVLPVLYGAYQLYPLAAAVTTLTAVTGVTTTAAFVLNPITAMRDGLYAGSVLGMMTLVVCTLRSTEIAQAKKLVTLAQTDPLTGLLSRAALNALDPATMWPRGLAMLLIDVDHFKAINDTHGHPAGDDVLVFIAKTVRTHCRTEDFAIRVGGDEFMVLFPSCSEAVAASRAEDLRRAISAHPVTVSGGGKVPVAVSIGVASCTHEELLKASELHDDALTLLYQLTDQRLYQDKQRRRRAAAPLPPLQVAG